MLLGLYTLYLYLYTLYYMSITILLFDVLQLNKSPWYSTLTSSQMNNCISRSSNESISLNTFGYTVE